MMDGDTSVRDSFSASGPVLSDSQFEVIAKIAHREFGLSLPANKKPLVHSRLSKRLRQLGIDGFEDYIDLCSQPSTAASELTNLLSALTTNVTHFFRERHHFDLLRQEVLPPLITRAKAGGRVRLWSAGCSSGQEAYSIAMTVLEAFPDAAKYDLKILATDIDPVILEQAKAGIYPEDAIPLEEASLASRYFEPEKVGHIRVDDAVRRLVTFGQINLIASWPIKGPFDVIFCRNVAIYFDKPTQANVLNGFCKLLDPGGYLMIGHSERVSGPATEHLLSVGVTAYRKGPPGTSIQSEGRRLTPAQSSTGAG